MKVSLGRVILLVEDYDKAFDFYRRNFFCKKLYDATMPDGQRYVHIGFSDNDTVGIWLLKADNPVQSALIGKQTGGQPTIVIYTNNCEDLYSYVKSNNVEIIEELMITPESTFFHCRDLYGNRLTVVELLH
ncbi:VOC family protein [Flavobacterium cerinum]|uniref:VOC family protein n=1 Tax=Flavobacterium cerinum TaxID=2502784 RepID=A0ABY5IS43_9FLAO|nr:VOC family protein [Flavobacterium cerinum]UUC44271.1 VOC family protein [Flavobacterium cerinum]